jgi:hypothetical protein
MKVFPLRLVGKLLAVRRLVPKQVFATHAVLIACVAVTTSSAVRADAITGTKSAFAATGLSSSEVEAQQPQADSAVATSFVNDGSGLFDQSGNLLLLITPSQSIDLFEPREKLRGKPGGSLLPDGVLDGVGSGVPPGSLGNVGNTCCSSGGGSGSSGAPVVTPEPSTLILLGSGIAIAVRRMRRAQRESKVL